jgi:integrase
MTTPGEERRRSKKKTRAGVLFPLRNERIAELTPERIAAWLEKEKADRPTVAARGYRLLRACLNWCSEQPEYRGFIDAREVLTKNVRRAVSPKPKDDCLQREQLKPWFEAVGRLSNPVTRAYLQCLLLTGARPQELARLQWTDVDFQWKTMTLRDKVEGDRQIPLTPHVAKLLTELRGRKPRVPRRRRADRDDETAAERTPAPKPNPWVFSSSRSESGRMGEANHAHTRAVKDAGCLTSPCTDFADRSGLSRNGSSVPSASSRRSRDTSRAPSPRSTTGAGRSTSAAVAREDRGMDSGTSAATMFSGESSPPSFRARRCSAVQRSLLA